MDDWEALGEDDIVLPVRPAREPDADPADWTTASTEAAPKTDARDQVAVKKDLSDPRPMIIVDMTVMERVPRPTEHSVRTLVAFQGLIPHT